MEFLLDKLDAVENKENQELICDVVNQFKSNVVNNYHKLQKGKHFKMSLVMRKPDICICENKDADQLRGNREADQRLCFRCIDSTIPLLSKSEISSV